MFFRISNYLLLAVLSFFWGCIGNLFDSSKADQFRLLYASHDGSYTNGMLFSMNEDGTDNVIIADTFSTLGSAVWSPNARKIAFTRDKEGYSNIFIMNFDGGQGR